MPQGDSKQGAKQDVSQTGSRAGASGSEINVGRTRKVKVGTGHAILRKSPFLRWHSQQLQCPGTLQVMDQDCKMPCVSLRGSLVVSETVSLENQATADLIIGSLDIDEKDSCATLRLHAKFKC